MQDSKIPKEKLAYYTFGAGEVIRSSDTINKEKPGQPTALKNPHSINIKGSTPSWIRRRPITPQSETVLLIDQGYNVNFLNGGVTEKSQIIHEKPYGGWAQRLLYRLEQNERNREARRRESRAMPAKSRII